MMNFFKTIFAGQDVNDLNATDILVFETVNSRFRHTINCTQNGYNYWRIGDTLGHSFSNRRFDFNGEKFHQDHAKEFRGS